MEMDNAVPGPFPTPPLPNFNVGKTAQVESQVVSTTLYQGDVYDTFLPTLLLSIIVAIWSLIGLIFLS